eukprot:TRINITY_DN449_c0_g1_i3.p1 TRINITY_DN449_c0_g1~~TRINITY_DN449_c0_g1_i3.p1  ORF type:complete len:3311 (-),score=1067.06 TRINITY_DN449_c0_g1_i3:2337-12269(-)
MHFIHYCFYFGTFFAVYKLKERRVFFFWFLLIFFHHRVFGRCLQIFPTLSPEVLRHLFESKLQSHEACFVPLTRLMLDTLADECSPAGGRLIDDKEIMAAGRLVVGTLDALERHAHNIRLMPSKQGKVKYSVFCSSVCLWPVDGCSCQDSSVNRIPSFIVPNEKDEDNDSEQQQQQQQQQHQGKSRRPINLTIDVTNNTTTDVSNAKDKDDVDAILSAASGLVTEFISPPITPMTANKDEMESIVEKMSDDLLGVSPIPSPTKGGKKTSFVTPKPPLRRSMTTPRRCGCSCCSLLPGVKFNVDGKSGYMTPIKEEGDDESLIHGEDADAVMSGAKKTSKFVLSTEFVKECQDDWQRRMDSFRSTVDSTTSKSHKKTLDAMKAKRRVVLGILHATFAHTTLPQVLLRILSILRYSVDPTEIQDLLTFCMELCLQDRLCFDDVSDTPSYVEASFGRESYGGRGSFDASHRTSFSSVRSNYPPPRRTNTTNSGPAPPIPSSISQNIMRSVSFRSNSSSLPDGFMSTGYSQSTKSHGPPSIHGRAGRSNSRVSFTKYSISPEAEELINSGDLSRSFFATLFSLMYMPFPRLRVLLMEVLSLALTQAMAGVPFDDRNMLVMNLTGMSQSEISSLMSTLGELIHQDMLLSHIVALKDVTAPPKSISTPITFSPATPIPMRQKQRLQTRSSSYSNVFNSSSNNDFMSDWMHDNNSTNIYNSGSGTPFDHDATILTADLDTTDVFDANGLHLRRIMTDDGLFGGNAYLPMDDSFDLRGDEANELSNYPAADVMKDATDLSHLSTPLHMNGSTYCSLLASTFSSGLLRSSYTSHLLRKVDTLRNNGLVSDYQYDTWKTNLFHDPLRYTCEVEECVDAIFEAKAICDAPVFTRSQLYEEHRNNSGISHEDINPPTKLLLVSDFDEKITESTIKECFMSLGAKSVLSITDKTRRMCFVIVPTIEEASLWRDYLISGKIANGKLGNDLKCSFVGIASFVCCEFTQALPELGSLDLAENVSTFILSSTSTAACLLRSLTFSNQYIRRAALRDIICFLSLSNTNCMEFLMIEDWQQYLVSLYIDSARRVKHPGENDKKKIGAFEQCVDLIVKIFDMLHTYNAGERIDPLSSESHDYYTTGTSVRRRSSTDFGNHPSPSPTSQSGSKFYTNSLHTSLSKISHHYQNSRNTNSGNHSRSVSVVTATLETTDDNMSVMSGRSGCDSEITTSKNKNNATTTEHLLICSTLDILLTRAQTLPKEKRLTLAKFSMRIIIGVLRGIKSKLELVKANAKGRINHRNGNGGSAMQHFDEAGSFQLALPLLVDLTHHIPDVNKVFDYLYFFELVDEITDLASIALGFADSLKTNMIALMLDVLKMDNTQIERIARMRSVDNNSQRKERILIRAQSFPLQHHHNNNPMNMNNNTNNTGSSLAFEGSVSALGTELICQRQKCVRNLLTWLQDGTLSCFVLLTNSLRVFNLKIEANEDLFDEVSRDLVQYQLQGMLLQHLSQYSDEINEQLHDTSSSSPVSDDNSNIAYFNEEDSESSQDTNPATEDVEEESDSSDKNKNNVSVTSLDPLLEQLREVLSLPELTWELWHMRVCSIGGINDSHSHDMNHHDVDTKIGSIVSDPESNLVFPQVKMTHFPSSMLEACTNENISFPTILSKIRSFRCQNRRSAWKRWQKMYIEVTHGRATWGEDLSQERHIHWRLSNHIDSLGRRKLFVPIPRNEYDKHKALLKIASRYLFEDEILMSRHRKCQEEKERKEQQEQQQEELISPSSTPTQTDIITKQYSESSLTSPTLTDTKHTTNNEPNADTNNDNGATTTDPNKVNDDDDDDMMLADIPETSIESENDCLDDDEEEGTGGNLTHQHEHEEPEDDGIDADKDDTDTGSVGSVNVNACGGSNDDDDDVLVDAIDIDKDLMTEGVLVSHPNPGKCSSPENSFVLVDNDTPSTDTKHSDGKSSGSSIIPLSEVQTESVRPIHHRLTPPAQFEFVKTPPLNNRKRISDRRSSTSDLIARPIRSSDIMMSSTPTPTMSGIGASLAAASLSTTPSSLPIGNNHNLNNNNNLNNNTKNIPSSSPSTSQSPRPLPPTLTPTILKTGSSTKAITEVHKSSGPQSPSSDLITSGSFPTSASKNTLSDSENDNGEGDENDIDESSGSEDELDKAGIGSSSAGGAGKFKTFSCWMIGPFIRSKGTLNMDSKYLDFLEGKNGVEPSESSTDSQTTSKRRTSEISGLENKAEILRLHSGHVKKRSWKWVDISAIERRRRYLQHNSVEIFTTKGKSYFFELPSKRHRRMFFAAVRRRNKSNAHIDIIDGDVRPTAQMIQHKWLSGRLTNFEYLMKLNRLAGRSYNDLNQYPIFPWVINYERTENMAELDLNDTANYRDFTFGMGAQTEEKRDAAFERYESLVSMQQFLKENPGPDDDEETAVLIHGPPFHFGTHYSNPQAVIWYLIRMEPFTSYHVYLQDGRFDKPDRQFHSIAAAYRGCLVNDADVKELTPEFYYLPTFLKNGNNVKLGTKQDGAVLGDVILPKWAKNPNHFIEMNAKALESDHVHKHLQNWVDLVFGFKQTGPGSISGCNVFFHLTYEHNVRQMEHWKMSKPHLYSRVASVIDNYGQTPPQLFKHQHPTKPPIRWLDSDLPLFSRFTQQCSDCASTFRKRQLFGPGGLNPIDTWPRTLAMQKSEPYSSNSGPLLFTHSWGTGRDDSTLVSVFSSGLIVTSRVRWEVNKQVFYAPRVSKARIPFNFNAILSSTCNAAGHLTSAPGSISPLSWNAKVAFNSHLQRLFVSGYSDGNLMCWCQGWSECMKLETQHKDTISCVETCEDLLATGSSDNTVIMWRLEPHGNGVVKLERLFDVYHDDSVSCLRICHEEGILLSGSIDGSLIVNNLKGQYSRSIVPERKPAFVLGQCTPGLSLQNEASTAILNGSDQGWLVANGKPLTDGRHHYSFKVEELKNGGSIWFGILCQTSESTAPVLAGIEVSTKCRKELIMNPISPEGVFETCVAGDVFDVDVCFTTNVVIVRFRKNGLLLDQEIQIEDQNPGCRVGACLNGESASSRLQLSLLLNDIPEFSGDRSLGIQWMNLAANNTVVWYDGDAMRLNAFQLPDTFLGSFDFTVPVSALEMTEDKRHIIAGYRNQLKVLRLEHDGFTIATRTLIAKNKTSVRHHTDSFRDNFMDGIDEQSLILESPEAYGSRLANISSQQLQQRGNRNRITSSSSRKRHTMQQNLSNNNNNNNSGSSSNNNTPTSSSFSNTVSITSNSNPRVVKRRKKEDQNELLPNDVIHSISLTTHEKTMLVGLGNGSLCMFGQDTDYMTGRVHYSLHSFI